MSTPLISDALWEIIASLLPPEPPKPRGGRPRSITDRAALTGIVFVLKSGIPWEMLPQELGCGSGMTCWRRLRDWQRAGMWRRLHRTLLQRLQHVGRIDWTRASLDSARVPAPGGANRPARIRRIVASWARSVISWSTAPVCRWRRPSQAPMCTTPSGSKKQSTPSRRCVCRASVVGDHANVR